MAYKEAGIKPPAQVTLPVWRSFVPSAFSSVIDSGILARFQKVNGKLIFTGMFTAGQIVPCCPSDSSEIVFKAIETAVLKPLSETENRSFSEQSFLHASHNMLLDALIARSVGNSSDRLIWLFSKIVSASNGKNPRLRLGAKALATCSMLSVRQVTRTLPEIAEKGFISIRPDKSIVINAGAKCFSNLET